ncbi:MAG: MarR family transcriptional regulator [Carnobacterium sp.]|uniref:MarR family winged helix-turn-helix transcriptional regulator n=1 Tax=unclassified Carnobacterium TaxID=257487 RepID=UPI001913E51C|nr:MarR family transcriptional regulator [Carnobacterium sp. CS13]QQP70162.1 MarR family transcriptional regulator [Carnobacterium sp. CS13]
MNLREFSSLLYQIKIANQEMTSRFEKATGFSLTRYELMMLLKETGKCSQKQIQHKLRIDSAAVTRHLKVLEEKEYVIRERNKENNREVFVEITEKAKQDLEICEKEHDKLQNPLYHLLSSVEEKQLQLLLKKLIKQEEV